MWLRFLILLIVIFLFLKQKDIIYYIDVLKSNFLNKKVNLSTSFNLKRKICILSMEDRDLEYIQLHRKSFQNYANLHNYQFFFEKPCKSLPIYFCKFKRILELMETTDCEYYTWIDSDAIVNKRFKSFPLESMIEQVGTDTDVITAYIIEPFSFLKFLIGSFYMFKKSDKTKKLLQDCIDYIDFSKWKNLKKGDCNYGGHCYEEAALFYALKNSNVIHRRIKGNFISNSILCENKFFINHLLGKTHINKCFKSMI